MIRLSNVLMATDFTRCSKDGREFARSLCRRFRAKLHLLHVIDNRPSGLTGLAQRLVQDPGKTDPEHEHQQEASEVRLWAELFPDYRKEHEICFATRFGHPHTEILNYARSESIDLIVVGTHGRTGLDHLISGSIAEHVVRNSPCPVLTIRASSQPENVEVDVSIGVRTNSGQPLKPHSVSEG